VGEGVGVGLGDGSGEGDGVGDGLGDGDGVGLGDGDGVGLGDGDGLGDVVFLPLLRHRKRLMPSFVSASASASEAPPQAVMPCVAMIRPATVVRRLRWVSMVSLGYPNWAMSRDGRQHG